MNDEQASKGAERLTSETVQLIDALGAAHRDWILKTSGSPTQRISMFAALTAMLKVYSIDGYPEEMRAKIRTFADKIELSIGEVRTRPKSFDA